MDFKDQIKQLADKINKHKELVQTEEATKHSFVMPFINSLGYDVFNPMEVMPEFVADIGIKKGEKVDYAVMKDGNPIILIECKHWSADLNPHNSQLFRYFHTTKAKFGILTNGFESRFYTDLVEPNKMDDKPFFVFDIQDIRDNQLEELKKFHKSYFDHATIVSTATELKYVGELKALINIELNNPSPDFVKFFAKQVHSSIITPKLLEQFTQLMKKSFQQFINDLITDRLKTALKTEQVEQSVLDAPVLVPVSTEPLIETTADETESFQIVRSIVRKCCPVNKIVFRDAQSYFAILYEDNNRKPICRMHLNSAKKYITLFNEEKTGLKKEIFGLDDLFNFSDELCDTVKLYLPVEKK
jgi:hypothetical protein